MLHLTRRSIYQHSYTKALFAFSFATMASVRSSEASAGVASDKLSYRVETAFLAGLCGDSLALAGHYEYDAKKIKDSIGRFTDLGAPGEGLGGTTHGVGWGRANYHPGKKAGDLTDAGEIAIMLLEYLAGQDAGAPYSFMGYATYWKRQIDEGYGSCNFQSVGPDVKGCPPGLKPGYLNGATRQTLAALKALAGRTTTVTEQIRMAAAADTNCLIAATHFLPLFMVMDSEEQLVAAAKSTVYLSHKNRDPVKAAEFLARALFGILRSGLSLEAALDSASVATGDAFIAARLADAKAKVAEARDPSSALSKQELADDVALTSMARLWDVGRSEPIKVGKASPTEGALPGALYFALKYEHSLEEALIANAGCGGDSAVRGMVIGMLLGAVHPREAIPSRWLGALNSKLHVEGLFAQLASRGESEKAEL